MANLALLQRIANEVEDLVTDPTVVGRFEEQLKVFNECWRKYCQAKKDELQPYSDPTGQSGKDGYEYDPDFKVWFPKDVALLPPDPSKWEPEDKLPCYYGTLAVIYDSVKGSTAPFELCGGILDDFAFGWMQLLLHHNRFDKDKLDTALRWVKADLAAAKPAETTVEPDKMVPASQSGSILGDTWIICGIPINVKELYTRLKSHPIRLIFCVLAIVLFVTYPLWWPSIHNKIFSDSGRDTINVSEPKTSGDFSPAISTSGPNSPVVVNYDSDKSRKYLSSSENLTEDKRLQITLKSICGDIDSRPLAQQEDTAKQYWGMAIKRECLRAREIVIAPKDEGIFHLKLTFPDEFNSPDSKWTILCDVSREQYPQLNLVREGAEFYVSGEIKQTFRNFLGDPYIELSSVILEFE